MSEPESDSAPPAEQLRLRRRIASLLWRGLSVLSLLLGIVGAMLPVLLHQTLSGQQGPRA